MILVSWGVSGGLVGAVGLAQLSGLPSQRLGEWAWGYCRGWAPPVLPLVQGGVCEGKIEKSITKAAQKKKGKRESETKGDGELQKAESYGALLINSIRGRPLFFLPSGTLMLHINLQGEAIKSSHCESGPSPLPDQHTVAMLYEAELVMSLLEK